ncbi:MAG: hypothetical protein ACRES3_05675 [Steroidobacteraceae bacterium]
MTTIPFGPPNSEPDPVLAKAAELPKEVTPPRDLWPAIAARLSEQPRRTVLRAFGWPAALAAGFLIAFVSALLTWGLMREPDPAAQAPLAGTPSAESAIMPVDYGSHSGLKARELAARDELLVEFREKFAQLSPQTRTAVMKNLAVIQKAANEIDAALAQDPASSLLNELLIGAYKQELQLYSRVVTAGDGVTRRT